MKKILIKQIAKGGGVELEPIAMITLLEDNSVSIENMGPEDWKKKLTDIGVYGFFPDQGEAFFNAIINGDYFTRRGFSVEEVA